jgi:hypothetical protein
MPGIQGLQRLSLGSRLLLALLVGAGGTVQAQQATAPPACSVHFVAELTPDVPNPRDSGFLSSLLSDNTGFRLYLQHVIDDTHLDLLLMGPGPKRNCREALDSIRKDSRIASIQVQQ